MTPTSITLPTSIATYFEAGNAGDFDALAAAFSENALIHDEGEDRRGRDAVKAWARSSRAKYNFTSIPNDVTQNDDQVVVTADVSGDFPGSPIVLTYEFTLSNNEITGLVIHD
jgi:hypothetical protein